ncbi:MAG: HD domain-containing protein [Candidatus Gastranaerophilales bacterium]|nr:HD domain-containing protein [Candidatus Gastranaerophilales bacterium]
MFSTTVTYEVLSYSVGDTKAGTKMGKLQLKNTEDGTTLNCVLWEETINRLDVKLFRVGNLVRIVSATFNERFNNCLITTLELIQEAKMGLSEEEREETFNKIIAYLEKIKDDKLKTFILNYFNEHSAKIKVSPAAKTMHHNYMGGLLVHTLECIELGEKVIDMMFQDIDSDKAIAACALHDIGKIFEYTIDLENGLIDYDEEFKKEWFTHSQYAYSLCMTNGFKEVAKMIAAHHGRSDWGAILDLSERDLEPYVYFVHHIDDLSAKFGKISANML